MSRPFTYVEPSPELRAVLKEASEAVLAGRFDQQTYEAAVRAAEAVGATHSDLRCIERYAIALRLQHVGTSNP